ncbi:carbamoyl-phosphate synthase (glutamine-hydrolyzing) large subunit [Candidatus Gottesmanbacteria bacterium]|nr:carbamoyl-phosphate synthase (glutamine-hydrolyzing) large subunit [Candidatus Gottesmanbacteria bacterium]
MKSALKSVIILGSGALKIGEAGEFDYSGSQALKALKEEGIRSILVNPNIATIQTSEGRADRVYFVPVTREFVRRIIEKERPDGIFLSFGGQSALNCGMDLYRHGDLEKNKVTILGTPMEAILATEDRKIFQKHLASLHLLSAKGGIVKTVHEGMICAKALGYPVMMRTGFALGGAGSAILRSEGELKIRLEETLSVSSQVILEECLYGWKEIEYEIVRDFKGTSMTVCNMENVDPVGIHTGESIVVAPSQTLSNDEYFRLREYSLRVIESLKIVGECNIQYALHPKSGDVRIIEVNARLSRSSALASKATGYPLAYVAAKLSLGKTLLELKNTVTQKTSAFFEPSLDYIVVKIPRWDLDKYEKVLGEIGSEMKSVGEVMAIGRSFEEAIQKAARMLNDGYEGVIDPRFTLSKKRALAQLKTADTMRLFTIAKSLMARVSVDEIAAKTEIDRFFIHAINRIVGVAKKLKQKKTLEVDLIRNAKRFGFSDSQIARFTSKKEHAVRKFRLDHAITPYVKRIDTVANEFLGKTNYFYCTYNASVSDHVASNNKKKIAVIGCGPYAVGTSVEFDWCAVNTVEQAKKRGYETIMINSNPETVSTDYDTSDYLYFEELTFERIADIYDIEQCPFIVSVGGQIPNNLSFSMENHDIPIVGTASKNIFRAESRKDFSKLLDECDIAQPAWSEAKTVSQALRIAQSIGYSVLVRPSFVLSGKGMIVLSSESEFLAYLDTIKDSLGSQKLVVSKFIEGAIECDVDAVACHGKIVRYALSEHVEPAGIHSGDSTLVYPSYSLSEEIKTKILSATKKILSKLEVQGPCNIQFLVHDDISYVIECNLRASRSVPFVSKVLHDNYITAATDIFLGMPVSFHEHKISHVGIKIPQFSFLKLKGADPVLRVEMRSTGEAASFGQTLREAYLSAILSTGITYPEKKSVFVSIGGFDAKIRSLKQCRALVSLGFTLYATSGTSLFLATHGIPSEKVEKIFEGGKQTFANLVLNKMLDFAIVIPEKSHAVDKKQYAMGISDGYTMRRMAVDAKIPIFTSLSTSNMFIDALHIAPDVLPIRAWDEYSIVNTVS